MKWKQIDQEPNTFALIFGAGDEVNRGLKDFAKERNLSTASFTAIGALQPVKLGCYNPDIKAYATSVELQEQVE